MSLRSSLIPRGSNNCLPSFPSYQNLAELHGLPVVHKCYLADHFARCTSLCHRDLLGHYGCVNAIEFSNNGGEFIVSGGDDRRVMVWNVEKCVYGSSSPVVLKGEHRSNIFCAVFDNDNSHIFSAGNDNQALRHDLATRETVGLYFHDDPVYGLSVHPEDSNVFLTACDDGNVLLWDARTTIGSSDCIAHYTSAFHAAVFNPVDPHLIATANSRKGVQLWDVRVPKNCLQQFSNATPQLCAMGLKWDMTGHMLTALRRRLPPVIYHISRPSAIAEFHHPGYSNVCTMKSNCFAGSKDQYIVSGSDDFNVYVWEVPTDWADHEQQVTVGRAFLVLHGHRSIVNQVRFNPASHMLLSAGVEKVVKVWSPFSIPGGHSSGEEGSSSTRRQLYSHHEYLGLLHSTGLSIPFEHARETTEEDPCMLAFFDSLIDREKNDPLSDSHDSFGDEFNLSFILQAGSGESSDSDSVGLSVNRLREILYQQSQDSVFGDQNEGVLRRLRHLSNSVAIRDLLHTVVDTTSSSSDDEDSERHVQVVLPEVPRENEQGSEGAPVRFNRHRHRRSRNYRHQSQARVESSSSGSSPSMVESSSSSSGEEEHLEPDHCTVIGRYSPCSVDDNSSSSSGTDSSNHQKNKVNTHRRRLKQRKQRLSQERICGLREHENPGDTQENGENHLPGITVHSATADCTDRTYSVCINGTDDDYCCQVHDSSSQSWVNESTDSAKSSCGDCGVNNISHDLAPDGCSASRPISNGDCIVPTLPGRQDYSGEEQGAMATRTKDMSGTGYFDIGEPGFEPGRAIAPIPRCRSMVP